jgi:hypothetical protein
MTAESGEFTELSDEFALVEQTAAEAGVVGDGLPPGPPGLGQLITISRAGTDVAATQPAALAAALDQLVQPEEQP